MESWESRWSEPDKGDADFFIYFRFSFAECRAFAADLLPFLPFIPFLPFTAPPRQSHSVVTRGWFLTHYEQTEMQGFCIDLPVFWILRTKIGKKRVVVTLLLKKTSFLQWCSRQRQVFLMTYPIETISMKTKNKRTRSCRIRHWVFMAPPRQL